MVIELSCAFATSPASHEHARIAEALGYRRAFFFDSPALYPDVWVQWCRAAERTERIGLGLGVLIPSLRHPMTNAAAIATLAGLAVQRLETIRAPTLIILGERDFPDCQAVADTLHQGIPKARKVVLPRVGHMSNMEAPERFNALLLDFLTEQ